MIFPFVVDICSLPCIDDRRGRHKTIIEYPVFIGIYKITSPKGAIYIGLSNDVYYRLYSCYRKFGCKEQRKIYSSLKKHGVENHTFEIIHIIEKGELNKLEIRKELNRLEVHYIKKHNSFSGDNHEFGMNLTRGGDSMDLTDEARKIISEKAKGRKQSPESIAKRVAKIRGRKASPETRKKQSESQKGKKHTEEHKRKNSEAHKGEKHSKERIQKKIGKKQKPETIAKRVEKISGENHWIKKSGGHKKETKDKISKSLTGKYIGEKSASFGKKHSDEAKLKNSLAHKGKKRTEESKKKQGDSIRGGKHHAFGKKKSEETIRRLSESHKGIKQSKGTRLKRSKSLKLAWEKRKKENKSWRKN